MMAYELNIDFDFIKEVLKKITKTSCTLFGRLKWEKSVKPCIKI